MSRILKIEDAFKHEIEVIDSNFPDEPEVIANIKNKIKEYGEAVRKTTLEEAAQKAGVNWSGAGSNLDAEVDKESILSLERSETLKIE